MRVNSMIKYGLAAILTGGLGVGLVACGGSAGNSDSEEATTTTTQDDKKQTSQETAADEKLDDEGDATVTESGLDGEEIAKDTMPSSGWELDTSDPALVTIRDPEILTGGERKVTIGTAEGVNGNTAKKMADNLLAQAAPGIATAHLDEKTVDGKTWYVFTTAETNGNAFYDKDDGDIRKVSWIGCTFDEAVEIFREYESLENA